MRRTIVAAMTVALALMMVAPAGATERPFRAMVYGSTTSMQLAGPSPADTSTFGGRCSVASNWVVSFAGTGQGTHLGRFTWSSSHCTQIDLATGTGTFSDGQIHYVAANGDTLDGTYGNGAFSMSGPTTVSFSDEWAITGGTGRFTGVSGSGTDRGWQEIVNGAPGPLGIMEIGTIDF